MENRSKNGKKGKKRKEIVNFVKKRGSFVFLFSAKTLYFFSYRTRHEVWWKPNFSRICSSVVVIPFHAWMDVRTASQIRKALELPARKYFESTHSPKDANSCPKPRPEKQQKHFFIKLTKQKYEKILAFMHKIRWFFLQFCWKPESFLFAQGWCSWAGVTNPTLEAKN